MPETKAAVMVYEARDGQTIELTFDTIRRYLVQGHPEFVVPSEFMFFMGVCKSQGMNPFKRDCYLLKYTKDDAAAIITAIGFLRSRGKAQQDCRGWNAGIILQKKDGMLEYREGTLILDEEKLVGGWFEAKPDGWDKPLKWTVPLKTYLKYKKSGGLTRFWSEDNQPGQIAKVAEVQGLRKCWPDPFQNLYVDAEIAPDDGTKGLPEIPEETGQAGESEAIDPDAHEDFDKKVPKNIQAERMKEFLDLVQQSAEKTLFEIKQEAFDHWDEFWGSFVKWQAKKYGEDKPAEPTDKDPIREQYINLRGAGFSTWVHNHTGHIIDLDSKYQKEIEAKWHKLYPEDTYPLDNRENATQDEIAIPGGDSEPDSEEDERTIPCSFRDIEVKVSFCKSGACARVENCADYKQYLEEQANQE